MAKLGCECRSAQCGDIPHDYQRISHSREDARRRPRSTAGIEQGSKVLYSTQKKKSCFLMGCFNFPRAVSQTKIA